MVYRSLISLTGIAPSLVESVRLVRQAVTRLGSEQNTVRTQRRHLTAARPRLPHADRQLPRYNLPTRLPARPSSRQAASPIPPGSSVPNVAGGLVSSHAECTEDKKSLGGSFCPSGSGKTKPWNPPAWLAAIPRCKLLYWPGSACLVSSTANSSSRERQSDRFLSSRGPTKVGVGGRIGGRGLNT